MDDRRPIAHAIVACVCVVVFHLLAFLMFAASPRDPLPSASSGATLRVVYLATAGPVLAPLTPSVPTRNVRSPKERSAASARRALPTLPVARSTDTPDVTPHAAAVADASDGWATNATRPGEPGMVFEARPIDRPPSHVVPNAATGRFAMRHPVSAESIVQAIAKGISGAGANTERLWPEGYAPSPCARIRTNLEESQPHMEASNHEAIMEAERQRQAWCN